MAVAVPGDTASAQSQASQTACEGIGLTGDTNDCSTEGAGLENVLKTVINIISAIVGVVAVIMIVLSGFKYITSGGDANKVSSANSSLVYSIVGLVIVVLAQVIVHFVIIRSDPTPPPPPPASTSVILSRSSFV
jgi:hypothetical protein